MSASVTVGNTAAVAGREVVQLYLAFPPAANEPPLVLRAFRRTALLEPGGAAERIDFVLRERDVSTWEPGAGWVVTRGRFSLIVGASSRDERLRAQFVL